MCDVRRRENAAGVLFCFFRSGDWKNKWRAFHSKHCSCCPRVPVAAPSHVVTPPDTGRRRGRGRPKKCKRGSGGGRNKRVGTPPAKPTTKKALKQRRLRREQLETYAFQSPPPFVPRATGRTRKAPVGSSVFVNGKTHTLVHSSTLKKWSKKKVSDLCTCCYARAPPVRKGRKVFMSDGSRIPSTSYACDTCVKRLCKYCHYHVWGPHVKGGNIPHGIVYSTEM